MLEDGKHYDGLTSLVNLEVAGETTLSSVETPRWSGSQPQICFRRNIMAVFFSQPVDVEVIRLGVSLLHFLLPLSPDGCVGMVPTDEDSTDQVVCSLTISFGMGGAIRQATVHSVALSLIMREVVWDPLVWNPSSISLLAASSSLDFNLTWTPQLCEDHRNEESLPSLCKLWPCLTSALETVSNLRVMASARSLAEVGPLESLRDSMDLVEECGLCHELETLNIKAVIPPWGKYSNGRCSGGLWRAAGTSADERMWLLRKASA